MSVYAITDLHGRYDLYEQVKAFLKPEDKVYFLGDAADRGPDGWKLIKAILNDSQFIYLKGNHEELLSDAMDEYWHSDGRSTEWLQHLISNGGEKTFTDWLIDGAKRSYIKILDNLPFCAEYTNVEGKLIWLSHSGSPPFKNHQNQNVMVERLALWDREHCWVPTWGDEDLDMIIVHGHTPIPYFFEDYADVEIEPGALWYCQDHKVCLDNASFATGYTCLFDLDTYDEHIFYFDETED